MIRMGVAEQIYTSLKGLVMRLIYAIKAVFYILVSGIDLMFELAEQSDMLGDLL